MNISAVLGVVLAISLAGNAGLGFLLQSAWKDAARFESEKNIAIGGAKACTDSIDNLASEGKKRQQAILRAIAASAGKVDQLRAESQTALAAKPDDPNDLCGSAMRYLQREIQRERSQ